MQIWKLVSTGRAAVAGCRNISTELTNALRPFYFAVHPDLFGRHPHQRSVNEDSLKQLTAYFDALYDRKAAALSEAKTLQFYIRDSEASTRDTFKLIKLTLDQRMRDPKTIIERLLELCNLSTDYIKTVKSARPSAAQPAAPPGGGFNSGRDYTYGSSFTGFTYDFYQAKEASKQTLDTWLTENTPLAHTRTADLADLREEVAKLQTTLVRRLGLRDVRYDCGWNYEHYRGCLKTLERLATLHPEHLALLRGRIVVFAMFTGVSLEGHVMLYTGDVLNNWLDFIRHISKHDAFLKQVPQYEQTLSQVLRNIKIGRRKFMPKQQAVEYAGHLMKVTTTLGDYLTLHKFPSAWPASLSDYEIVIESEAGPLMVNPTGQLIAPATCPGFMLIDFISTNLELSKERTLRYHEQKHIEVALIERCVQQLELKSLTKEDSVTPDKMIETLEALLRRSPSTASSLRGINLHITNYFSVLADGIVCIPWDFESR